MEPFNLVKALSGDPVVCRDGTKVVEIHLFNSCLNFPLIAVLRKDEGVLIKESFNENGIWDSPHVANYDLFMAPKTKKIWFNVYPPNEWDHHTLSHAYNSEQEAKNQNSYGGKIYSLEIEE